MNENSQFGLILLVARKVASYRYGIGAFTLSLTTYAKYGSALDEFVVFKFNLFILLGPT